MNFRFLLAVIAAAAVGSLAYSLGLTSEVVYVLRSIVRQLVNGVVFLPLLGMISLVSGPPGNGKSYYAIRKVARALEEGKVVAGNVELEADWPRRIVRRNWVYWLRPFKRRRFLREARERFFFSEELDELASIRLLGRGEGRGLMVLDEGHNWMNARSWSADDRKEIVRFFSQHRKLGWDILLIAQHPEMIDKQVRNLVEYNVYLRNLKKAKWGGVPIFPFNLFLAVWCWHSANRVVVKREVFRLGWPRLLYDTFVTSHGLDGEGEDPTFITLPSPPEERPRTSDGPHGRTAPAPGGRAPDAASEPPQRPENAPGGPFQEHSEESGEGEAWSVTAPLEPPSDVAGTSNSLSGLKNET